MYLSQSLLKTRAKLARLSSSRSRFWVRLFAVGFGGAAWLLATAMARALALLSATVMLSVTAMLSATVQAQAPRSSPDRFQISADGQEVLDQDTRLIWRRCLEGMRFEAGRCLGEPQPMAWPQANDWAKAVSLPSSQWRMPTMMELSTVIDMNRHGAPVDPVLFPDTPKVYVWSATVNERTPSHAWVMFYANGYMMSAQQSIGFFARLVREKG